MGWGGLHSHFHVKPNRCVVLYCVEVGVLTISIQRQSFKEQVVGNGNHVESITN